MKTQLHRRSKGLQSIQGLWLVTVAAYIQWCPCLHRYFPCTVSWISIQIPTCTVSWFSTQIFSMHRWKTTEFRSRNTFLCIPLFSVANESKAPLPAAAWIWRHISNYIVLTETDRPPALLAVLASLAGSCYQGDRVAGSLTARSEAAAVARGRSYQGPGRSSGRGRDPPSHSGPLIAASSRNRCSFAPSCEAAASRVLERLCSTSFGARQSFKRKTIWFGWFSDSSGWIPLPDSAQNNLVWMILGQFRLNLPPRLRSLRRHCSAITADNIQQRPVGRKLLRLQVAVEAKPAIIEGSLEVKLPTIWTVEKQRWEESEETRSEERRGRCAKR